MMKPVSYIAEAPTFSAGEIMIALAIMLAALAALAAVIIVGISGFYRLGQGDYRALSIKFLPIVAVFDLLVLVSSIDESLLAFAPLGVHALSFFVGVATRQSDPASGPQAPPDPPAPPSSS